MACIFISHITRRTSMRGVPKTFCVLGTAMAAAVSIGTANADDQPSQVVAQKTGGCAVVEKVDAKKRELSLRDDQGTSFLMDMPEEAGRLDALKPGDRLNVDFYQSMALSIKKSG